MINEGYIQYLNDLAKMNKRPDGRGLLDYRKPITIKYGISKNAEGSAEVTIGKTRVVCGVKMELGEPFADRPDEGSLMVTAEFAAVSSPMFEPGAPGEGSIELARVVDRGIRESGAIDVKKLCIKPGEKIWLVMIDMYIQNHDGNLIDACALAAIAALKKAIFPKLKDDKIDYGQHTKEKLPIEHTPIACTFQKIGNYIMLDTTAAEEEAMTARMTITIDETGTINAAQKGGSEGLSEEEISKCIDIAVEKSKELRKHIS